ncbi:hypothetical protein B0H34DRAFT_120485 [Crassisporium funariophilum]|nr:hypothetical protein B0H34DRAFT_120485 [Crassisporium funariophilum]
MLDKTRRAHLCLPVASCHIFLHLCLSRDASILDILLTLTRSQRLSIMYATKTQSHPKRVIFPIPGFILERLLQGEPFAESNVDLYQRSSDPRIIIDAIRRRLEFQENNSLSSRIQFVNRGSNSQTSESQTDYRVIPDVDDITPFPGYNIDELIAPAQPWSPPPSNPGEGLGALHQIDVWNGDLLPTPGNDDISGELNHSTFPYVVEGQDAPPYSTAGAFHGATVVQHSQLQADITQNNFGGINYAQIPSSTSAQHQTQAGGMDVHNTFVPMSAPATVNAQPIPVSPSFSRSAFPGLCEIEDCPHRHQENVRAFWKHLVKVHAMTTNKNVKGGYRECRWPGCMNTTQSRGNEHRHTFEHAIRFQCPFAGCTKNFSKGQGLTRHGRDVHEVELSTQTSGTNAFQYAYWKLQ